MWRSRFHGAHRAGPVRAGTVATYTRLSTPFRLTGDDKILFTEYGSATFSSPYYAAHVQVETRFTNALATGVVYGPLPHLVASVIQPQRAITPIHAHLQRSLGGELLQRPLPNLLVVARVPPLKQFRNISVVATPAGVLNTLATRELWASLRHSATAWFFAIGNAVTAVTATLFCVFLF
eukprot:TRINITY_DN8739_c0_g1_i1.p1 TRINITY_DN8739_c0_g1~~TRINITY_DN8739_c0_g1_i1.p1  ORF type:complete len:179 (+),score=5.72 TRINITY_DN8739_c0_g1_i1:87-623(+)